MVDVGQTAPDFTLPSDQGKKVTLYQELGSGPVVLSFYVFDFTGVCTAQACDFREEFAGLQAQGAKVFGISTDSHQSRRVFRAMHKVPYPLLSDWNKKCAAYGVLYNRFGDYEGVSKRSVFVLDKTGVVRFKWVTEDAKVPRDVKAVAHQVATLAGAYGGD